ncbi:MAG: DUF565 domain-containing protein [Calothrix sp. C42_A2020_038]|nr:DUF565 domain-containing protein [Calothrix sp. C42_A2020_038]
MQNTRLNTLVSSIGQWLDQWLSNPWRRWSVLIICFLFGFFLGTAVSTVAGQRANLDIYIAAIIVLLVEVTNRLYYRHRKGVISFWIESLNTLKVGLTYSLFVEAFKLGS